MVDSVLLGALTAQQILIPVLAFVSVGLGAWLVVSMITGNDAQVDRRLKGLDPNRAGQGPLSIENQSNVRSFEELLTQAANVVGQEALKPSEKERSKMKSELSHAGWRSEHAVTQYMLVKLVCLVFGCVLAGAVIIPVFGTTRNGIMYAVICVGLFMILPSVVLGMQIKKRKEAIFLGLPDALDLMVVCVEAGLGLDAAMRKVCEEMARTCPILSEEFSISNFHLQMGKPRRDVLHDLGDRTGVDDMKSLAAILIQADRFGASIAQALRVQSDAMRVRRKQLAEERAAKCAVKLLIPLILFIFPAIFVVLVGPAGIRIAETFGKEK